MGPEGATSEETSNEDHGPCSLAFGCQRLGSPERTSVGLAAWSWASVQWNSQAAVDKHENRLCVLMGAELQDTLFSTEAGAGTGM